MESPRVVGSPGAVASRHKNQRGFSGDRGRRGNCPRDHRLLAALDQRMMVIVMDGSDFVVRPHLQSWCVNDPIRLLEARLQATDDFRFEAPPGNGRFLSQPMMEVLGQPQIDHPTPRALYQGKGSANRSKGKADNQASNSGNGDGHGDTPTDHTTISAITILPMVTDRMIVTDHLTTRAQSRI